MFVSLKRYLKLHEEYINLKRSFDALSKAFEATEHCCPYDNEKCSKTNCFVVGGGCARRTRKELKND